MHMFIPFVSNKKSLLAGKTYFRDKMTHFVANDRFKILVISIPSARERNLPVRRDFSSHTRRNDSIDEAICHSLIIPILKNVRTLRMTTS